MTETMIRIRTKTNNKLNVRKAREKYKSKSELIDDLLKK